MGIFQGKQSAPKVPDDELTESVGQFFDGYFQELNERGRVQFEARVEEHAAQFKQDLDATVARAGSELKEYLARRFDDQFAETAKVMKESQDAALLAMTKSVESLQLQHQQLSTTLEEQFEQTSSALQSAQAVATKSMDKSVATLEERHRNLDSALQKNVARQDAMLTTLFEDNKSKVVAMQEAQTSAIDWLNRSIQALQQQHEQLSSSLQENVAKQEDILLASFEDNMAQIVEHYLLGALGDQYDLKAQLPSIIHQMEVNKQAIVDDMKL